MGTTLKKLFTTGQGAGADDYPNYAPDLDSNFTAIESDITAVEAQISSVIGTNAILALRAAVINDPSGPVSVTQAGVIGEHSFRASISGQDLNLTAGVCISTAGAVIESVITGTVTSAGLDTTSEYFISLDVNGVGDQ